MEEWDNKYNSELTTIKNKEYIKGHIIGMLSGLALAILLLRLGIIHI